MRTPLIFLALLALLPAPPAAAQRVIHRVRFGETLAEISARYYKVSRHADLLRLVNGFSSSRKLQPGERIRIPTAWVHTVKADTTLDSLAAELLGDRRRWQALAQINDLRRKRRIKRGTRVVVPFVFGHIVSPGESFNDIARRYLGSERFAEFIASYNLTKAQNPAAGARVELPLGELRLDPLVLEELTNQQLLGVRGAGTDEAREALQEANAMLRRGEYWAVPLRLVRLLGQGHPLDHQMADVFKLLAVAYVAVDRTELAQRAFREALLRRPDLRLDPVATSPKVIRVLMEARQRINKGKK